ncbi:MAG: hypothetical protein ACJ75B_10595 [Flavisolibacter sp.]
MNIDCISCNQTATKLQRLSAKKIVVHILKILLQAIKDEYIFALVFNRILDFKTGLNLYSGPFFIDGGAAKTNTNHFWEASDAVKAFRFL